MTTKNISWEEAIKIARNFSDHYSMEEDQQKAIYKYASQMPKGSLFMELGTCNGKTSALFAYIAKYNGCFAYGIDDFSLEWNANDFNATMKRLDLPFTLLVGKTNDVPWEKPIDFLLIDAGHDEENMKRDTARWIPFVKKGGYVAFHDYEDPYNPNSAHRAVRFYADQYTKDWQDIDYVYSNTPFNGLKIRKNNK